MKMRYQQFWEIQPQEEKGSWLGWQVKGSWGMGPSFNNPLASHSHQCVQLLCRCKEKRENREAKDAPGPWPESFPRKRDFRTFEKLKKIK